MQDFWLIPASAPHFSAAQRRQLHRALLQAGFALVPAGKAEIGWYQHPEHMEAMLHHNALHLIGHRPKPHGPAAALADGWLAEYPFLMSDPYFQ